MKSALPQYDEVHAYILVMHGLPESWKWSNEVWNEAVLRILAYHLGMTPMECSCRITFDDQDPCKSGVSAVQVIAESHIAIHTWPGSSGLTLTVYSCRRFDRSLLIEFAKKAFRPEKIDVYFLEPGETIHCLYPDEKEREEQ